MEEKIIFKTYNSFEADQIIAALGDAQIPAYKREHGIGQLVEIAAGMSRFSLIEIIIPEEAEDAADEILENMGLFGSADESPAWPEDSPQGKAAILDDFAMFYETAVMYLEEEDYLEEFCYYNFIQSRDLTLIPSDKDFYESLKEVSGDDPAGPIFEKTESLFGLPKRIMVLEEEQSVIRELEACEDGWGPFYVVFGLMFCEYDGFTLCFISGTNN